MEEEFREVPIVDVSCIAELDLERGGSTGEPVMVSDRVRECAAAIGSACRDVGFFYVRGYESELPAALEGDLDRLAREFFEKPLEEKMEIHMRHGGRAWRGFFPVGEELTSGKPDIKEGLYLGQELPEDDPRVRAGVPMHGRNLFPREPAALRDTTLRYMAACERLAQKLMMLIAVSLRLPPRYFADGVTRDPLCLFRIFHYPPPAMQALPLRDPSLWSVGAHTDYGVLTLLRQDAVGGLQVRNRNDDWVAAPPIPGTLVCNIGDMLECMTLGLYRSTLHRVRNPSSTAMRVSLPFFFDPGFDAEMRPLPLSDELLEQAARARARAHSVGADRWDGRSPLDISGTYGAYVLGKVSKVFPDLAASERVTAATDTAAESVMV